MNKYVWETADEIDLALAERAKKNQETTRYISGRTEQTVRCKLRFHQTIRNHGKNLSHFSDKNRDGIGLHG